MNPRVIEMPLDAYIKDRRYPSELAAVGFAGLRSPLIHVIWRLRPGAAILIMNRLFELIMHERYHGRPDPMPPMRFRERLL